MNRILQLTILTAVLLLGSTASQVMAQQNYYWTGKGNNNRWNTTGNWSLSSNGPTAPNLPGANDNVIFDANSFINNSTTVTINVNVTCNNWTWNSTTSATLATQGSNSLQVNGNFNLNGPVTNQFTGTTTFGGSGTSTLSSTMAFAGPVVVNKPSGTLNLGSAVTFAGDMTLTAGTLNTNGNTINIEGNWSTSASAGTFTAGTSIVRFQGGSSATLATSATNTFNNLVINKTNSTNTVTLSTPVVVNGSLTITNGVLAAGVSGNNITLSGDWSSGTNGTYTHNNNTVTFNSSTPATVSLSTGSAFHNLVINKPSSTINLASAITVNNDLTITNGSFVANGNNITLNGSWSSSSTGTFTHNNNTVTFSGSNAATIATSNPFNRIIVNKTNTLTLSTPITLESNLTITSGTLADNGNQITGAAGTLAMSNNTILSLGSAVTATTFPEFASNSLATGSTIIYNSGVSSVSTVTAATPVSQLIRGGITYGNLTLTNASASGTVVKELGGPITVLGNFTINTRNILRDAGNLITGNTTGTMTMDTGTELVLTTSGSPMPQFGTYSLAGSTVNFSGTTQSIRGVTYGNLVIAANTTQTLQGNITVANQLTINGSLAAGTNSITLAGNWISNNGTFDAGTGTVTFNGTSTITTNSNFNNLAVSGTATLANPIVVAGSLNNTGTLSSNNNNITVAGNWSSTGIFNAGTATVTLEGGSTASSITSNTSSAFNNLVINKAVNLASAITVNNNLTLAGALSAVSSTNGITLGGNWVMNTGGSFTPNGNTVTFTGTNPVNIPTVNFHSITIEKTSAGSVTLTQSLSLAGNLTVSSGTLAAGANSITTTGNLTISGGILTTNSSISSAGNLTMSGGTLNTNSNISLGGGLSMTAGTLNATNNNITLAGDWSLTGGTFTNTGNTVTMQGGTAATITSNASNPFNNLVVNKTASLSSPITVNRNLTIAGALSDNGNQISGTTAGTLAMSSGSTLTLGTATTATTFPTNFAASLDAASTVIYNSGQAQTVRGGIAYGNLTIAGGSTKTLGDNLNINGDLNIQSGNTLATNNRNIDLQGNWTSNGTFTAGTGRVTFSGSRNTTITTNTNSNFSNVSINKASASNTITQLTPATVTTNIDFVRGVLVNRPAIVPGVAPMPSPNKLILQTSATATNASDDSFVDGSVDKTTTNGVAIFTYPIGEIGWGYRPMAIVSPGAVTQVGTYYHRNPSLDGYNALSTSNVTPSNSTQPLAGAVSQVEYWTLQSVAGNQSAKVQVSWEAPGSLLDGNTNYLGAFQNIVVAAYNFGTGTWDNKGGTNHAGTNNAGTVEATEAINNNLSIFTFGSIWFALPIDLLYFRAAAVENNVQLDWATATEINNDYFTIEKSADGKNFSVLSTVNGKGNSKEVSKYTSVDYAPYNGVTYYRLKQTDFDGKSTYSKTVAVKSNAISNSLQVYQPASKALQVTYRVSGEERGMLTIHDSRGVQVWSKMVDGSAAEIQEEVRMQSAASGMYIVTLQMPSGKIVKKVMMF